MLDLVRDLHVPHNLRLKAGSYLKQMLNCALSVRKFLKIGPEGLDVGNAFFNQE
ncbi:hypothetical protein D3C87_2186140 [compost metagenome]